VSFRASELVAAPLTAPSLLARDDAVSDQATTTAPATAKKNESHQNAKL
jgi:hypothetical protein